MLQNEHPEPDTAAAGMSQEMNRVTAALHHLAALVNKPLFRSSTNR